MGYVSLKEGFACPSSVGHPLGEEALAFPIPAVCASQRPRRSFVSRGRYARGGSWATLPVLYVYADSTLHIRGSSPVKDEGGTVRVKRSVRTESSDEA